MSWIVPWQGKDYDVDPHEFSAREMREIKRVTGLGYEELISALPKFDGDAIAALFWTVDRRDNPELSYASYDGPSLKVVMAQLDGLNAALEELGKAMGMEETETDSTPTSPSSPNGSDGPEPSTTL